MANADALLLSVSADIRQLQKQMDKAQGIVRDSSRRMVRTVDAANENISQKLGRGFGTAIGNNIRNLSGQVGNVSDAFSGFGAAGIAASAGIAAGLIAVTVAAKQAQAALELGDMIADEAEKVGIGTDALQEYQYAIAQTGGEAKDAAPAIAAFTRTLGAAQSGLSPKAMKAFTALGFTKEQLKSFDSAEDALRAVSDKVAALGSEAERAAVAEKLGLTPLLPLLRQGTVEMDRLRKAAHDLGYVLDEDLVKSLGDLKDKSDAASQVLKVQLAAAFAGVAGSIVQAKLALADFLIEYNKLVNSANGKRILGAVGTALTTALPGGTTIRALSQLGNKGPARVTMADLQAAMKPKAAEKPDGTSLELPSTGGGGSKKDSAAQDAATRAARQARVDEDIYRASLAEFDIYNGERRSIEERAQFALDRLDIEEKHRASELTALEKQYEITAGKEGISKAERAQLENAEAAVRSGDRLNIREEAALRLADERLRYDQDINSLATDLLSIAEGMATTQAERRKIQLQILSAEREIARKALAESLERNPNLSPEQRTAQLGAFDAGTKARAGQVLANTRGPLEDYFAGLPSTIDQVNERMEALAANGIGSVIDGLADAAVGARSLRDVFRSVVSSMLAEITRINLQKALGGMFGTGGSGGLLSGLVGGALGGGSLAGIASKTISAHPNLFANGTDYAPGGLSIVGERGPELLNIPKGGQVIPNDILRSMSKSSPAGNVTLQVNVNAQGAIHRAEIEGMVRAGSMQAVSAARQLSRTDAAQQQYASNLNA